MKKRIRHPTIAGVLALASVLLVLPTTAGLERMRDGVYKFEFDRPDDLLDLDQSPDVRVLVVADSEPKHLTEAHLALVRAWVRSGGVLWAVADGLDSSLTQRVAPVVSSKFDYKRPTDGKRGGDLILRGVSPKLKLGESRLMDGVDRLYLFPRRSFEETKNTVPLVEMTDSEGSHGVVLASVAVGDGMLVLDGTARDEHAIFRKLRGFDEDHPNAIKRNGEWRSYDWERIYDNAVAMAEEAEEKG